MEFWRPSERRLARRQLTWRVPALAVALVAFCAALIGASAAWGYRALIGAQQEETLTRLVAVESLRLGGALRELRHDVRLLAQLAHEARPGELARVLRALLESKPSYEQARVLEADARGHELVRVERTASFPAGRVRVVPESELRDKGHRDYFRAALAAPRGDVYLSEINLNREDGEIQVPHTPTLRAAIVLQDEGGAATKLALINLNARTLLRELYPQSAGQQYYLVNGRGDYLLHPEPGVAFAWELGSPRRIQDEHPGSARAFEAPRAAPVTTAVRDDARLLAIHRVDGAYDDGRALYLAVARTRDELSAGAAQVANTTALLSLALVAVFAFGAYALSRNVVRPLTAITQSAASIASGERDLALPTERDDELGSLARAFEDMLGALDEQREELEESNRALEQFVHVASHDLREPIRRAALSADLALETAREGELSETTRDLLTKVRDSVTHSLRQVSDLRALTRIETDERPREEIALEPFLRAILDELRPELEAHGVRVELGPMSTACVYPGLLELLVGNLLRNVLRHSEPGCALTLRYQREGQRRVLRVRNTRPRSEVPDADELCQAFRRHGETRGTGLGLTICARVVQRHGGEIRIRSSAESFEVACTLEEDS